MYYINENFEIEVEYYTGLKYPEPYYNVFFHIDKYPEKKRIIKLIKDDPNTLIFDVVLFFKQESALLEEIFKNFIKKLEIEGLDLIELLKTRDYIPFLLNVIHDIKCVEFSYADDYRLKFFNKFHNLMKEKGANETILNSLNRDPEEVPVDPLRGLDHIEWEYYEDAYGTASSIPEMLRKLASKNPKDNQEAWSYFYSAIYHQGTIFGPAEEILPFLFDLLYDEKTNDRDTIIDFILNLAFSTPEMYMSLVMEGDDPYQYDELPAEICEFVENYEDFYKLFDDEDPIIRLKAAHAASFFTRNSDISASDLRERIDKEEELIILATDIFSLGVLNSYDENEEDNDFFEQLILESHPYLVKVSALIGRIIAGKDNLPPYICDCLSKVALLEAKNVKYSYIIQDLPSFNLDGKKLPKRSRGRSTLEFPWKRELKDFIKILQDRLNCFP